MINNVLTNALEYRDSLNVGSTYSVANQILKRSAKFLSVISSLCIVLVLHLVSDWG